MDVEVNEENIDLFALVEFTGNSREVMLSRAAEARQNGYILSVKIPDDELHHNVFESYLSQTIDSQSNVGCRYEMLWAIDGSQTWMCIVHGQKSKHDAEVAPNAPCLQIDPEEEKK